ncbi:MAG: AmmeMemoRadiSam system protein B [Candidatus Eremiobacteraeota bacterium]|nr:AmmeMemoRadiSam system protein B [Candidatus Eremiobacteraeota bacterium]
MDVQVRSAVVSGSFYPYDEKSCGEMIDTIMKDLKRIPGLGKVVAGIVPHAGWIFSGPTAGKVFAQIDRDVPHRTFILLGAVHRWAGDAASVYSKGAWETPLGPLHVNEELACRMMESLGDLFTDNRGAHQGEHSIEVQLPFIARLFPGAAILPIALPPGKAAFDIGKRLGAFLKKESPNAVVIGTTDLTHYGPSYGFAPKGVGDEAVKWSKEVNDASIIKLALEMKGDDIYPEARANHNACGAGAMAGTAGAALSLGATKGVLVEYTTSLDMMPGRKAHDFVGYAGIVYY